MWGFLVLFGIFFLAAPPGIAGAAYVFYRLSAKLNSPRRQLVRVGIVLTFGATFILVVAVPIAIILSPWLVQFPLVQKITHYDPKQTFRRNMHRLSEESVPYEKAR